MEFGEVLARRRMVRDFTPEPIAPDALDRILDAALRAPSAGHTQGWGFLVLEGSDQTERFWSATFEPSVRARFRWQGLFNAPVIVVPCSNESAYLDRYAEPDKGWSDRDPGRWPVPYWHIDTGFAAMQLQLAVVNEGLGALFFGIFGDKVAAVRRTFGIPDAFTPIGAVAVGHPAGPQEPSLSAGRGRKSRRETLHFGNWN